MDKQDIIRMAREAGIKNDLDGIWCDADQLIAFAALVRSNERDACAKVADLVAREIDDTNGIATYIAAAIRARGQK